MFHCHRKENYGFLSLAGCNQLTIFHWAEIRHPAVLSDYLARTSLDLGSWLTDDNSNITLPGHTITSDNDFVKKYDYSSANTGVPLTSRQGRVQLLPVTAAHYN